jgi:hypothetical protein
MRKSWTVGALVAVGVLLGATACGHGTARHVKSELRTNTAAQPGDYLQNTIINASSHQF